MKKKYWIIIAIIVLLLLFVPKPYALSGGGPGGGKVKTGQCMGYEFSSYPADCVDCYTIYYCVGIPLPSKNR